MTIDVKVPASGESVTTANVARWHKKQGDSVRAGELLVTLETDKVSTELESPANGTLEIVVEEGMEVPINETIAKITVSSQPESAPQEEPIGNPAQPAVEAIELRVPAAGESVLSANIASWRREDGSKVDKGDILVVLETDKISTELEAPVGGVLRILASEGTEVPVGGLIGKIEAMLAENPPTQPPAVPAPVSEAPLIKPEPAKRQPDSPVLPTPQPPPPSTPATAPSPDGRTTRRRMSMLRRKIATQLVNAQHTAAILTTFNEVDMSAVMDLRKSVQEDFLQKHGIKLGLMSFFIKASAQALKDVPSMNARIDGDEIIENHFYDIGVAIGTDKGLVVPVIRDADHKTFAELEQGIADYANKVRDGKLTIADLQGGVFTISNGGTYGSLLSTPILNPPQSGILGMHTIQQRPVALNGQVVIRPMMYLALSYDHRLVDGKEAVTFLIRVKEYIESPSRLLLEM